MAGPFDLERFVAAQDAGGTYAAALAELRAGRKRTHWMWFVFPQVAGLGRSATAQRYAVSGLAEARAYLAHPVLGTRLVECAEALAALPTRDAAQVLGSVDAQKLRSSMTLFLRAAEASEASEGGDGGTGRLGAVGDARAGGSGSGAQTRSARVFAQVLDRYFRGEPDRATLAKL